MRCPKGCKTTGKKPKPIQMIFIETKYADYDWYRCPKCGHREYIDKR